MKIKVLIILLFILLITGCEKKESDTNATETKSKPSELTVIESDGMTNVFKLSVDKVTLPGNYLYNIDNSMSGVYYGGYDRMMVSEDKVYTYFKKRNPYVEFSSSENTRIMIHAFNEDSNEVEYYELIPNNFESSVVLMYFDSEFNYVTIEEVNGDYTLNKLNKDADETIFSIPIDDIVATGLLHSLVIGENDNIYIATESKIFIYTKDGERICEISPEYKIEYISSAQDKKPIVKLIDYIYFASYAYIDAETKSLKSLELDLGQQYYTVSHIIYGEGYDYYHVTNNGIYGYDIASNTLTKTLDWHNSDMNYLNIKGVAIFSPDKILILQYDASRGESEINVLNRVPDDEIPDKTYIILGCIDSVNDLYLNTVVSQFNRQSDEYRIVVKDYFTDYETDSKIRLNNEIAAGNIPDLLFVNSSVPFFNYAKKGFFVDLYDYLENDKELYDDLLPFTLKPTEIDGKLNQLVSRASIYTNIGKFQNVGDIASISMNDMYNLYKSLPDNILMSNDMVRYNYNTRVLDNLIVDCLDYDNGTCNFTMQTIENYISLMKQLPEYMVYYSNQYDDYIEYRDTMDKKFQNDEMYLYNVYITDIFGYIESKYRYSGGDEINFIGYPTTDGNVRGDYIDSSGFAIFNTSENKDGAWEFIKYCYSTNIMNFDVNGFVPTYTALDKRSEVFQPYYFHFDNNGSIVYRIAGGITKEQIIEELGEGVCVFSEDEEANFIEYMESVSNFTYTDIDVVNIFKEELEAYYNTDKSPTDVAEAIQSRVSIYMSEIWG